MLFRNQTWRRFAGGWTGGSSAMVPAALACTSARCSIRLCAMMSLCPGHEGHGIACEKLR